MSLQESKLWRLMNSGLVLWLLSSVVLSGGAWLFQEWRDEKQQETERTQLYERLALEAAGRTAQFQSWLSHHILAENQKDFRDGVTAETLRSALIVYAGPPQQRNGENITIYEVLPEFKSSSLYSIYAQLQFLNEAELQDFFVSRNLRFDDEDERLSEHDREILKGLRHRSKTFTRAMIALSEPDYLTGYKPLDFDIYATTFFDVFLGSDVRKYNFPYSDCFC